jgi:hypothetical protein
MVTLPSWSGRVWAWLVAGALFVSGVVGFLASSTGLIDFITRPRNDTDVMMLPDAKDTVAFEARHPPDNPPKVLKAGTIVVDGITLSLPDDSLVLANKLDMRHGGSIRGRRINVVATIIEGGSISVSGSDGAPGSLVPSPEKKPTAGSEAGDVMVAAAAIDGTTIRADGGKGGDGAKGVDGMSWPRAPNGVDGDCGGFGHYRGNTDGIPGQDGHPGGPGQDGAPGGNGGNLLVLVPKAYPPPPATADKGAGGLGGHGGSGGPGQIGGAGGSGCVGLGGSQGRARDGANGKPALPGIDGKAGSDGSEGTAIVRHMPFQEIEKAWRASNGDSDKFVTALHALPPR